MRLGSILKWVIFLFILNVYYFEFLGVKGFMGGGGFGFLFILVLFVIFMVIKIRSSI